jgi:hypothetical protein
MNEAANAMARIDAAGGLAPEPLPSFAEVAGEIGGAWPRGWYKAEIISGYSAGGFQFTTSDTPSKAGDSRNMRIALKVTSVRNIQDGEGNSVEVGATRNTFFSTNYRLTDLTAANVQRVKDKTADTRLKIVLQKLGQIERALGLSFVRHPEGHLMPERLVGQQVDVRFTIGEKGYNEVNAFEKSGKKTA